MCAFVWERKFEEKINLHIIINDIYNYNAESAYQGRKCILYLVLGISRLFPLSNFFLSADKSIAKERKASKMLCRQDSNSRPLDQKYNVRRLSHAGVIKWEHFKNYVHVRKVYFCRQKTAHQKTDQSITAP